jgi:hypothetical protein
MVTMGDKMNYKLIYDAIITQARQRVNYSGYLENHHIIPKFLGGDNSKKNLVKLTPREHYLCHLLLTKFVPDQKKYAAVKSVYMMLVWSYTNENRVKCIAGLSKKVIRCRLPSMPESTKQKLSEATTSQFEDPEKKARHLAGVTARWEDPLERGKQSTVMKIRFESEEEHTKISESLKRYNQEHGSPNKGRSFSHLSPEERKEKFGRGNRNKGSKRTPEACEKMKAAWVLRKLRKEAKLLSSTAPLFPIIVR